MGAYYVIESGEATYLAVELLAKGATANFGVDVENQDVATWTDDDVVAEVASPAEGIAIVDRLEDLEMDGVSETDPEYAALGEEIGRLSDELGRIKGRRSARWNALCREKRAALIAEIRGATPAEAAA